MFEKALNMLEKNFGYKEFRKGQEEIIKSILDGRDSIAIMPTGAGKSICYQIPALVFEGTTIVVSPLISLMKDQVDSLGLIGVNAAFINSSLSNSEYNEIIKKSKNGFYKLLYIAPERIESEGFFSFLEQINVPFIAVDEAHCISHWGHDFRPSYKRITQLIKAVPTRPVVAAFTATATKQVENDIESSLNLNDPVKVNTGFDRENLYYSVYRLKDKFEFVIQYINQNIDSSGIIYCLTRKSTEEVCEKLKSYGIKADIYHAGLSDIQRSKNQEDFVNDNLQVIVATNAFGMGIDKSNVRFVIHFNMPKNMESYYQEAGRAGRDGERANCILLFSPSDIIKIKYLINLGEGDKTNEYRLLSKMIEYCNTENCLRKYILNYFGEHYHKDDCESCGSCLSDNESGFLNNNENINYTETDITTEALKILSCIKRMGERYGAKLVCDVLRGSHNKKVLQQNFNYLKTFGIMKNYNEPYIKEIINYLLKIDYIKLEDNIFSVLKVTNEGMNFLKNRNTLHINTINKPTVAEYKKHEIKSISGDTTKRMNKKLFEELKILRKEIATSENMPPYIVFSDSVLNEMCRKLPENENELLDISGVGTVKLKKYGELFLKAINDYLSKNDNIDRINVKDINTSITSYEKNNKSENGKTQFITYNYYIKGLKINEIAEIRNLTDTTIENHLISCSEYGLEIDFMKFIQLDYLDKIIDVIKQVGTDRLKIIKELLPESVSYTSVKFAVLEYKKRLLAQFHK